MTNTERVLRARIQAVDNYTQPMRRIITQTRAFQSAANRIRPVVVRVRDMASRVLDRISRGLHSIRSIRQVQTILRVVDQATNVIKKVANGLVKFGGTVARATVRVADKASSLLSNIMGKLSILAAGVTIGVAVKQVAGGAMELEQQQISMKHFMGVGNKDKSDSQVQKMSDKYLNELVKNANATPFGTSEVISAGRRSLQIAGGSTKDAKQMLLLAEDMAALNPGKTVSDAMEALADMNVGEMERIKEFGLKASSKENPKDVQKKLEAMYDGGAEKLSKSTKGKFSTATGTLQSSLANFGTAFLPVMSSTFDSVTKMLDGVSPKFLAFSERLAKLDLGGLFASFDFSLVTSALQPVTDLLDKMFTGIETKSPVTMGIMQVLGTIFNVVFNGIGAVISAVTPTVEGIFRFIGEHGEQISMVIQALGAVWNAFWSTAGVLLGIAWAVVKPILDSLVGLLGTVGQWIKDIGNWWTTMCDKIKNNPITAKINQVWEGVTSDKTKPKKSKKSAFGTHRVVGNDVPYRLHDGERVLTASDSRQLDNNKNQGVVINVNGMTIREEADLSKFAKKLVREFNNQKISFGGSY